jgi:hypothetical protein
LSLNLKVCDDGVLIQQQTSWTLSIILILIKNNVLKTGISEALSLGWSPAQGTKTIIETKVPPGTPNAVMAQTGMEKKKKNLWRQGPALLIRNNSVKFHLTMETDFSKT